MFFVVPNGNLLLLQEILGKERLGRRGVGGEGGGKGRRGEGVVEGWISE